ncbi:MAG: sulfurtransferase [Nitrospiraceae bacterium]|nr:MAG: sulfurtransferase [Nitrospiraceae bacterium]
MRLRRKAVICIISVLFMVSVFAGFQDAYAKDGGAVVETQWLADNLNNVKIVFVDNWPSAKESYEKKHVPGSVYMGIGALMGTISPNPPDKAQFEGMMNRLGINNNDHVVLYGIDGESVFTLGAYWLMEYFGHKKVSYLNGGLAKWNKENRASESGMKVAEAGKYKVGATDESIRIVADDVLKNLNKPNFVLVDARGTGEYKGEVNNDKNKRVGHIPGALDLDYYKTNFNADGTLKSVADLKAAYESKGVTKDKEVVSYCQGGIKAANAYFVLSHILGYKNVKVYVGSWGEWSGLDYNKYPIVGKIAEEKK